jgi:hypothetical protein
VFLCWQENCSLLDLPANTSLPDQREADIGPALVHFDPALLYRVAETGVTLCRCAFIDVQKRVVNHFDFDPAILCWTESASMLQRPSQDRRMVDLWSASSANFPMRCPDMPHHRGCRNLRSAETSAPFEFRHGCRATVLRTMAPTVWQMTPFAMQRTLRELKELTVLNEEEQAVDR